MQKDNYMNPNKKARWGFSGSAKKIKAGAQTVGETGGVEHARAEPEDAGARNNGGGASKEKTETKKG